MKNARSANGNLRRKNRERFKAMDAPCGICRGRFGPIRYDQPSDHTHPLSFVIDEIKPISRWKEFGYKSAREAAEDFGNLQAAHWICNAKKGARVGFSLEKGKENMRRHEKRVNISDGDW